MHFNCSHFSVETEFTFGSDIGHFKFPLQADKGEHSWQLSGWCQLKVFCSILLKSFQNSCILKICMSFQRIEFKVYIFTAVIHWGILLFSSFFWCPANKRRNKKGKTKKKNLGEFLNTHEHTFSRVSLLKIKKKGIQSKSEHKIYNLTIHQTFDPFIFRFPILSAAKLPADHLWKTKNTKTHYFERKTKNQENLTDLIWWSKWQVIGKQLISLWQNWKTVGRCLTMVASSWAMMANSWAMFSSAGKQLGGVQHCWQTVWI